jgi:hypothetical protein
MWTWLEGLSGGAANFVGSLTGSLVGLVAILIGALFNAYLNRQRDDALREADRRSIVVALKAELDGLNKILLENASSLDSKNNDFYVPDLSQYVRTMPVVLQKIGLLDVETVKSVMESYSLVDYYETLLMRLGGRLDERTPEHSRVLLMPQISAKQVITLNRGMSEKMKEAIKRLDASL